MSKESAIGDASQYRPAKPAHIIVVAACLIALTFTFALFQERPPRFRVKLPENTLAEVSRLEQRFHECYARWTPAHGVRSPCPEVQNDTNIGLLNLLGLQMSHPSELVRIVGNPEAVYENGRYPGIFYWQLKDYWATTAPNCVMLLPRNPQYDAMILMSLQQDGSQQVSVSHAISNATPSKPTNNVLNPNGGRVRFQKSMSLAAAR